MMPRARTVVLLFAAWCAHAAAQDSLTFVDLVKRMIDLEQVAVLPQPGERGAMWASTDRRSRHDEATGKYVHWHANGDGNHSIRREGDAIVMAEMAGPGVVWRIWSAKPERGHVQIVLDGQETPAVDMPFAHYFDAKHPPFNYPSMAYDSARGKNLYFPIPYQKSCKIVGRKGWGRYFQITYATFPKGTTLPSFSPRLAADAAEELKKVDAFLRQRLSNDPAGERPGQQTIAKTLTVVPGQTATVARLDGPRAITALRVTMSLKDRGDQMAALRRVVLQIRWDGEDAPAVWCPLGDFFGTAPGVNLHKSLPVGMTKDGFYSYWYMPFAKSAVVELINEDEAEREIGLTVVHAPLTKPVETLGRFHAKWHRDVFPVPKDRWPDWTVVRTKGRGRFCGMMLHVWNPRGGQCPLAGEGRWWWGEGDEKFFVDGETYPSTFGTGSEDYFGYAWGNPTLFARPYHNQTISQGNAGHISVNRWQIVDNVPFHTSFDGCIEKYFPNDWPTLYAAVAYWYLAPDGEDPHGPVPVAERHGYYVRPPLRAGGFTVRRKSAGKVSTQRMSTFPKGKWTDNHQLWWTDGKPGDTLDIVLPVPRAGRYDVQVILTKAKDYAIVQLALDGEKAGEPIDLYSPDVVATKPISLGVHDLAKGDHTLTVEIKGANDKALKRFMFGLDAVKLLPAP